MLVKLPYKDILGKVIFPVYEIPEELSFRDGLLKSGEAVIDDKNQKGHSLGNRRLTSPHKLYKLNRMCEDFVSLMKSKSKQFIDSHGNCFYYLKTSYATIKPIKIKNIEFLDYYCRIWLVNHNSSFVLKSVPLGKEWAHVIMMYNEPWLIYDFSEELCKSYKRMI